MAVLHLILLLLLLILRQTLKIQRWNHELRFLKLLLLLLLWLAHSRFECLERALRSHHRSLRQTVWLYKFTLRQPKWKLPHGLNILDLPLRSIIRSILWTRIFWECQILQFRLGRRNLNLCLHLIRKASLWCR